MLCLEVIDFERGPVEPTIPERHALSNGGTRERLASCEYFAIERFRPLSDCTIGCERGERFTIVVILEGAGELTSSAGSVRLEQGQTLLLPASLGSCRVKALETSEPLNLLTCVIP